MMLIGFALSIITAVITFVVVSAIIKRANEVKNRIADSVHNLMGNIIEYYHEIREEILSMIKGQEEVALNQNRRLKAGWKPAFFIYRNRLYRNRLYRNRFYLNKLQRNTVMAKIIDNRHRKVISQENSAN